MKIRNTLSPRLETGGFSLIEVTISVAITAVALVSLMGMLPQGMKTMAAAVDTAITARIHQQVVGELLLTEWEQRNVFNNEKRGYDDQGIHIQTNGSVFVAGRKRENVIYQARIRVPSGDVTLPGGDVDPNLQLVLVDVTSDDRDGFDFDDADNQRLVHTYQSIIVKMGQNFEFLSLAMTGSSKPQSMPDGDSPAEPVAAKRRQHCQRKLGFTLPELLVAMTVLSVLLLMLTELLNQVQRTWTFSENRISQFREARVGFDIITKNLSQAALNTYWDYDRDSEGQILRYKRQSELHFKTGNASQLGLGSGMVTHALFFQAPLGFSQKFNNLSALYNGRGYFVQFGDDARFKPSFIQAAPKYRFRLMEFLPPAEQNQVFTDGDEERYSDAEPVYDQWYKYGLDEHTHPLADNIIALIVSPRRSIGDAGSEAETYSEIAPDYGYDSNTVVSKFRQQVPPLVRVTMVAIDETTAVRFENGSTPPQEILSVLDSKFTNTSAYNDDLGELEEKLREQKINYRVFSSMVAIRSAKWSTFDPADLGS